MLLELVGLSLKVGAENFGLVWEVIARNKRKVESGRSRLYFKGKEGMYIAQSKLEKV